MQASSDNPRYNAVSGGQHGIGNAHNAAASTEVRSKSQDQNGCQDFQTLLSSQPLTFPQFEMLPVELRDYIWREHLKSYGPRIVEIRLLPGPSPLGFYSPSSLPAMLSVNQLSRKIGQERYQLLFGSTICPAQVHVDFSRDVVFLGDSEEPYGELFDSNEEAVELFYDGFRRIRTVLVGQGFICKTRELWDMQLFVGLEQFLILDDTIYAYEGDLDGGLPLRKVSQRKAGPQYCSAFVREWRKLDTEGWMKTSGAVMIRPYSLDHALALQLARETSEARIRARKPRKRQKRKKW